MSKNTPPCPQCTLDETHLEGANYICDTCGYEWPAEIAEAASMDEIVKDANGSTLADGDTVVVIKDLKVKGSSTTLKVGTKIKNIRLRGGDHAVEAGGYMLKAEFLRKA
ncbi:zinc ribbon domain-containing protein YjdM [Brytella acorum]|uniref:Zinc ribbon domain-containing protein YjdM n=1 Tax=Brytella acorum TaxID=2959299 RepID=A0AA35UED6_9PROT|nr:zinc ribbon domain-containing protein YjdM [Brytella acorum]MDF3625637.1 zinc ribbon domain-containing protein YjdM [Brytella acorum]CAI9119502.1 zinc ribbon domain-containing protein YjdM [Brytella acorum]